MISKKEFEYTVGRNLAKYRKEKKLTQMQVAEMAVLLHSLNNLTLACSSRQDCEYGMKGISFLCTNS